MRTKSLPVSDRALMPGFFRSVAFLFALILTVHTEPLQSQSSLGFNYQAIARDVSGDPLTGMTLPVLITIQSDSLLVDFQMQRLRQKIFLTSQKRITSSGTRLDTRIQPVNSIPLLVTRADLITVSAAIMYSWETGQGTAIQGETIIFLSDTLQAKGQFMQLTTLSSVMKPVKI